MTWKCVECGSEKKDTYRELCRRCHDCKAYAENKEKVLEKNKRWRDKHKEERRQRRKVRYATNRDAEIERSREYYQNNKNARTAYNVEYTKKRYRSDGEFRNKFLLRSITRQTAKKQDTCQSCGSKEELQFHHPDYSKPKLVITLCKNCHYKEHGKREHKVDK